MKNYYDTLGIDDAADANQVKRAYFNLVKQYPPERFPEEFKEIRAAYDTLSDENKRAEYDEAAALPEDAAGMFNMAQIVTRQGQHEQAAAIYEKILKKHPALLNVRAEYARELTESGKTGKAISAWETICVLAPGNAKYAAALADCYLLRGWRKKAVEAYRKALEIDDSDAACWISLIHCYLEADEYDDAREITLQAIEAVKKGGNENIRLYHYAFMLVPREDAELMEGYLRDIVRLARGGVIKQDEIEQVIPSLLSTIILLKQLRLFPYIREIADSLAHLDDDLREKLMLVERKYELETLVDNGYSDAFYELFDMLDDGCECDECTLDIASIECYLLSEIQTLRPQFTRLKNEFPRLYAMHDGFLNEVLFANARNIQKMLDQRLNKLSKAGYQPNYYYDGHTGEDEDDLPVQQTIRRDMPKIGRNDPCPCGSGKKYKKCCGA